MGMKVSSRRKAGLAAVALVVLVGVVAVGRSGSEDKDGERSSTSKRATLPPAEAPTFVPSGSSNIYAVDIATRALEQLTKNHDEQMASEPIWSPKGKIVFSEAASPEQPPKLFRLDPDGSGKREIATRLRSLYQPSWSPDGRNIAVAELGKGIYVVDTRTGATHRLEGTTAGYDAPAWSPDGETIAFQRNVSSTNWDLYQVDPSSGRLDRLTRDPLQQLNPTWSPDGSRLAFAEQQKNGRWAIVSMKVDGSDRRLLTHQRFSVQDPSWSPDGKRIAAVLQEYSRDWIVVIDSSGGDPVRISPRTLVSPVNPSWSPDSRRVIFAANTAERPPPGR